VLKHRVIPCVLLKDWQLTKSVGFKEFRTIGHPKVTAKIYNKRNVDELIVLDIDASSSNKEINYKTLSDIAKECFMPLTLGGGIKSLEDISKLLKIGADKVALNTIAIQNPLFIKEASSKFGTQCIVVSVDVLKEEGEYKLYNKNLGVITALSLMEHLKRCEELGAGEILLTNIEHDGMQNGYDLELIKIVSKELNIPVIANAGASTPQDALKAIQSGADAIAAASIFHFTQYTPNSIKNILHKSGLSVRL